MTVSMPEGVERHWLRRVRKESMLEGIAASRAPSGSGWRLGVLEGGFDDGIGSPEGRSAMGAVTGTSASGAGMLSAASAMALNVWCWRRDRDDLATLEFESGLRGVESGSYWRGRSFRGSDSRGAVWIGGI